MPNVDTLVQDGITAIKAGRKDEARRALMKAVELDEHNEQGWLWLSAVVETTEEQQICLENVIAINPSNEKARKGLAAITQGGKAAPVPSVAPTPAPAAPTPDPFGGGFDSNPFAGTGFDSNPYGSNANDPAVSGGWDAFDAGDSGSTPASSVDWNRNTPAPAYGSGKEVAQPSADEYDSWVSGLSLGGDKAASSPAVGSFGGASSDFDNADPFGSSAQAAGSPFDEPVSSPATSGPFDDLSFGSASDSSGSGGFDFGGNAGGSAFSGPFAAASNNFDEAPDPFGSFAPKKSDPFAANDPFASSAPPPSPTPSAPASARRSPESFASQAKSPSSGPFGPASEDPVADLFDSPSPAKRSASANASVFGGVSAFGDDLDAAPSGGSAFIGGNVSPGKRAFFKAIPPEIQASGGGKLDVKLVATVAVLAVLNMMSFALLLLNLTKR